MLEKIIDLLNMNEWYDGDEYVQIAKGKYERPTTFKKLIKQIKRWKARKN